MFNQVINPSVSSYLELSTVVANMDASPLQPKSKRSFSAQQFRKDGCKYVVNSGLIRRETAH